MTRSRARAVRSVMLFVDSPGAAADWYAQWVGLGSPRRAADTAAVWLSHGGVEIVFHPADEGKNPHGGSTVVYWTTDDLNADVARLVALGARPHRGPMRIESDRHICQLVDPWGNLVGLDGPVPTDTHA